MLLWEIVTHDPNQSHPAKITGRVGKIGSRSAENSLARFGGGFDTVERDGSNNEQWHQKNLNELACGGILDFSAVAELAIMNGYDLNARLGGSLPGRAI
jgi:hypothetical protein